MSLNYSCMLCTVLFVQMSAAQSLRLLHCYSKPGITAEDANKVIYVRTQSGASSHHICFICPGTFGYGAGVMRPFSLSVQREGFSKYCHKLKAIHIWQWIDHVSEMTSPSILLVEYVNAQELPTDMKSITDRAATTLLWTELFRGDFFTDSLCHP